MTRARTLWLGFAAFLALSLASAGQAQTRQTESANFADTGAIVAIDAKAGTLAVKGAEGESGVYQLNADTTIMNGDKKVKIGDLQKGWRVVLNGDLHGGKKVATYVEVVDTSGSK